MQGNTMNFIPIGKGKKVLQMQKDLPKLIGNMGNITDKVLSRIDTIRRKQLNDIISADQAKNRELLSQEHSKELAIELATNIYTDPDLSRGTELPPYYPAVPEYSIPQGRKYTSREIRGIQDVKRKANAKDFVSNNITITRSPMTVEEFNKRCDSLIKLNPGILRSTIIHERDIDVITGQQTTLRYSYPEITAQVGYLVNTIVNPDQSVELTGIYVYQNSTILRELLAFLANLDVSNTDDMIQAQITLRDLYFSITPKP